MICFQRDAGADVPSCPSADTSTKDDYCVTRLPTMLVIVGDNGVPSSVFPLQECEGDCDTDEDCDLNLVCQLRDDFEEVPGCIGKGSSGKDYCRSAPGPEVTNSPSKSPTLQRKQAHQVYLQ